MVVQGVEVDRDAERRADLVLATVAATDSTGVVEVDGPALSQLRGQILGLGGQVSVARQRQHGDLDRREPLVEPEHDPLVHAALGVGRLVLGVSVKQECHQRAGQTGRRLDDVGDESFAGGLIEVGQIGARTRAVCLKVEVCAVGDALQLAPLTALKTVPVLDVHGPLGVVGELLLGMLVVSQVVLVDPQVHVPLGTCVDPVLVPLLVTAGHDEELHLHLLELTGAEDEVARSDLVTEALADLRDAERGLLTRRVHYIDEVEKDSLRSLGTQIVQARVILDNTEVGLEQARERPGLCPRAAGAAVRTCDGPKVDRVGVGDPLLLRHGLLQMVCTETPMAGHALG